MSNEKETSAVTVDSFVGRPITLQFNQNASTGYMWNIDPAGRENIEVSSEVISADKMMVGGDSLIKFTLVAKTEGQHVVNFHYKRPWETGDPVKKIRVVLNISP